RPLDRADVAGVFATTPGAGLAGALAQGSDPEVAGQKETDRVSQGRAQFGLPAAARCYGRTALPTPMMFTQVPFQPFPWRSNPLTAKGNSHGRVCKKPFQNPSVTLPPPGQPNPWQAVSEATRRSCFSFPTTFLWTGRLSEGSAWKGVGLNGRIFGRVWRSAG